MDHDKVGPVCKMLVAFRNEVATQDGKGIVPAHADDWRLRSVRIEDLSQC